MRSVRGKGTEAERACTPPHLVGMGTGMPARMAETGMVDNGTTEKETGIEAGTIAEMATALTPHQGAGVALHPSTLCKKIEHLNWAASGPYIVHRPMSVQPTPGLCSPDSPGLNVASDRWLCTTKESQDGLCIIGEPTPLLQGQGQRQGQT